MQPAYGGCDISALQVDNVQAAISIDTSVLTLPVMTVFRDSDM